MTDRLVSDNDQDDDDIVDHVTSDDGIRMINREKTTVRLTAVAQLNGSKRLTGAWLS